MWLLHAPEGLMWHSYIDYCSDDWEPLHLLCSQVPFVFSLIVYFFVIFFFLSIFLLLYYFSFIFQFFLVTFFLVRAENGPQEEYYGPPNRWFRKTRARWSVIYNHSNMVRDTTMANWRQSFSLVYCSKFQFDSSLKVGLESFISLIVRGEWFHFNKFDHIRTEMWT